MTRRGKTKWVAIGHSEFGPDTVGQPPDPDHIPSWLRPTATPHTPFDDLAQSQSVRIAHFTIRDFPSLSGTQQPQQSNTIWSNPNLRAAQHTPVQRPGNTPASSSQQQSAQSPDGPLPGSSVSPFAPGADGYRFGGQSGGGQSLGQLAGLSQTQSGNTEEFPPLGGLGNGDIGPDSRRDPMQSAFSGNPNGQSRLGLTSPLGEQAERAPSSAIGENRVPSGSRKYRRVSPFERMRGQLTSHIERVIGRTLANPGITQPDDTGPMAFPIQQPPGAVGQEAQPPQDPIDNTSTQSQRPQQKRLHEMTDKERFGLPGFLVTIDPNHPDYNPLAMGQDLTQIGLDLSRPDSSPLYPTFATPFADATARAIIPEFSLPASYTVTNVPPLMSKIANFSDDTLFAIFYQYPRDVLQELAAQEL